jgi:hypothetical protein
MLIVKLGRLRLHDIYASQSPFLVVKPLTVLAMNHENLSNMASQLATSERKSEFRLNQNFPDT